MCGDLLTESVESVTTTCYIMSTALWLKSQNFTGKLWFSNCSLNCPTKLIEIKVPSLLSVDFVQTAFSLSLSLSLKVHLSLKVWSQLAKPWWSLTQSAFCFLSLSKSVQPTSKTMVISLSNGFSISLTQSAFFQRTNHSSAQTMKIYSELFNTFACFPFVSIINLAMFYILFFYLENK